MTQEELQKLRELLLAFETMRLKANAPDSAGTVRMVRTWVDFQIAAIQIEARQNQLKLPV